jgi:diamine N-acetyltransferase
MKTIDIIYLNEIQLADVAALALEIWPQAYSQILSQNQINYMLEMMYSSNNLNIQYRNGQQFIGIYQLTSLKAFASFEIFLATQKIKIHKIYVHPQMQGSGWGIAMFNFIKSVGITNNCTSLFLNVNKYNKALAFYKKLNMHIAKEEIIDIGHGYIMDDYVMELKLD